MKMIEQKKKGLEADDRDGDDDDVEEGLNVRRLSTGLRDMLLLIIRHGLLFDWTSSHEHVMEKILRSLRMVLVRRTVKIVNKEQQCAQTPNVVIDGQKYLHIGTQTDLIDPKTCMATQTDIVCDQTLASTLTHVRYEQNQISTQTQTMEEGDRHGDTARVGVFIERWPLVRQCSDAVGNAHTDNTTPRSQTTEEDDSSSAGQSGSDNSTNVCDVHAVDDWSPLQRRHEALSEDGGSDPSIRSMTNGQHPESENSSDAGSDSDILVM